MRQLHSPYEKKFRHNKYGKPCLIPAAGKFCRICRNKIVCPEFYDGACRRTQRQGNKSLRTLSWSCKHRICKSCLKRRTHGSKARASVRKSRPPLPEKSIPEQARRNLRFSMEVQGGGKQIYRAVSRCAFTYKYCKRPNGSNGLS